VHTQHAYAVEPNVTVDATGRIAGGQFPISSSVVSERQPTDAHPRTETRDGRAHAAGVWLQLGVHELETPK
jgi:hypothetical protein